MTKRAKKKAKPGKPSVRKATIATIERDLDDAREAGSWSAVAALHKVLIKLRGIDEPPTEPFDESAIPADPLDANLYRVQFAIRQIFAQGKVTGVDRLLRQERECVAAIEDRDRQRAADAAPMSPADVVGTLVTLLDDLPPHLLEQLQEAITERVDA